MITYKKISRSLMVGGLLSLAAFSLALAKSDNASSSASSSASERSNAGAAQEKRDEKICERFSNGYSRMSQVMEEAANRVRTSKETREENFSQKEEDLKARLERVRAQIDENFSDHIQKMLEMAQTDSEKAAVTDFQTAVKNAAETRRQAVDAARTAFRNEMETQLQEGSSSMNSLVSSYQNSVKAAFDKASSDCNAGSDASMARSALLDSLKQIREKFQNERQNQEKVRTTLEAHIKVRNEAIQKANQDFQTALEAAKEKLKNAFPATD